MSQGSSSSFSKDSIGATRLLSSPVGQNLANSTTRTLVPSMGAVAYDSGANLLYYGSVDTWNVAGQTGISGAGSTGLGATGRTGLGATGNTGQPGITSVGPFSSASNANGATIASQVLTLYSADVTNPGGVNVTGQSFSGAKNFRNGASFNFNSPTPSVSKILTYYDRKDYAGTFGGALAGPASFAFQRVGSFATILSGTIASQTSSGGVITFSTAVDPEFRTTGAGRNGMIFYIENSVFGIGVIEVDSAGNVSIAKSINSAGNQVGFAGAVPLQLVDSVATYSGLVNY